MAVFKFSGFSRKGSIFIEHGIAAKGQYIGFFAFVVEHREIFFDKIAPGELWAPASNTCAHMLNGNHHNANNRFLTVSWLLRAS